jgi:hypothetical protein
LELDTTQVKETKNNNHFLGTEREFVAEKDNTQWESEERKKQWWRMTDY